MASTTSATATSAAAAAAATTTSPFGDISKLPHDTHQPNIIACAVITLVLAGFFVAARFYTRMFITRTRIGASEWLVLVAWIFSFGVTIPQILEAGYGNGAHYYLLGPGQYNGSAIAESQLISILFYSLSLTFSKLSILALYILIFNFTWVRTVSFFLLAVVCISQIWMCYVIFSACVPLRAFWDMTVVGAVCHPQAYWLANQYQLIATDFLIFLLPLPIVWRLKVRPVQKILVVFVFAMGFFVCAISIIRIELIIPLTNNPGPDFTYATTPTYYWTDVETNLAIVVAASITLRPFVSRLLPKRFSGPSYEDENGASPLGVGGDGSGGLNNNNNNKNGSSGNDKYGGRRSLFDPIITFGSRPSRKPASVVDDTQALRTQHSRIGSQSTSDVAGNKSISSKVDEEMGNSPYAGHPDVQMDNLTPLSGMHSMSSDQTLKA